ncbi:hypothetical protein ADK70_06275 [Streptomyces rimosus subsp. pseudoverticillatus]|uniref:DUF397 domain-containing protein n=1 Tax=Streptomyces rimosus TaxID=1927 RepID=UPI0006B26610|nr:DUF397 domain-containing protein [Streptomyces rimosus]KOT98735.1 hypothetical protein ADK70_06275 [Streptomyces rimosus subsp. pseudoverticillatus]
MPRLTWQKSSYSGSGQDDCLEVTPHPGGPILYREGDHPTTVGRATAPSWAAFLRAVKADRCAAGFR